MQGEPFTGEADQFSHLTVIAGTITSKPGMVADIENILILKTEDQVRFNIPFLSSFGTS